MLIIVLYCYTIYSLPEDLHDHSYCFPSNASPTPPPTHPSPPGELFQSTERFRDDQRTCVLCAKKGDSPDEECGRLLSCGVREWVHINCAYWSAEVFVLDHDVYSGMLFDFHAAVSRGRAVVSGTTLVCVYTAVWFSLLIHLCSILLSSPPPLLPLSLPPLSPPSLHSLLPPFTPSSFPSPTPSSLPLLPPPSLPLLPPPSLPSTPSSLPSLPPPSLPLLPPPSLPSTPSSLPSLPPPSLPLLPPPSLHSLLPLFTPSIPHHPLLP